MVKTTRTSGSSSIEMEATEDIRFLPGSGGAHAQTVNAAPPVADIAPEDGASCLCAPPTNTSPSSSSSCSSKCKLHDIRMFVAVMSFYILFYVSTEMYLTAVITTIEKRFGFTSSQSGMLLSSKEITFFCTVTFVSHFARNTNRPRLIGIMGYIGVLAGYVSAIPHFFFRDPMPIQGHSLTDSQYGGAGSDILCRRSGHLVAANDSEEMTPVCDSNAASFEHGAYGFFVLSAILLGLSQSCHGALSATYIDDSSSAAKSPLYLGIISAMRPFGPMVSFLLGGLFTSIPENFTDSGIDPKDPRWIGAWWLGYIVCPSLYLIPSTMLLFFPKRLHSEDDVTTQKEISVITEQVERKKINQGMVDFVQSLRRLLSNPVYMIYLVSCCLGAFIISGMFPFLPKYIETQFNLSASTANILLGSLCMLLAGCGIFLGGLVQSKLRWHAYQSSIFVFFINIIFMAVMATLMFIGCDQPPIAGLANWGRPVGEETSCPTECDCHDIYQPVCAGGVTYMSACHAGCITSNTSQVFTGCGCIGDGSTAVSGPCESGCTNVTWYLMLLSGGALIGMMAGIPGYIIILRSVADCDRSLALGFLGTAVSVMSFVPGPVVFGALVDSACLVWRTSCAGDDGACLLYDNRRFRYLLHGTTSGLQFLSNILCAVVAVLLWRRRHRDAPPLQTPELNTPTDNTDVTIMTELGERVASL